MTYLLKLLWDTLLVLDDLTASTNSVMMLLRELLAHPLSKSSFSKLLHSIQPSKDENSPICTLIPRLYPFLRHNVGSVRLSVLNTIHWLLELDDSVWLGVDCMDESTDVAKAYTWIGMLGEKFPRFIFQNFVLEDLKASSVSGCIVSMSHSVWERMLNRYPPSFFSATYHELWAHCVSLCATPLGVQPKASLILLAKFPSCDKGQIESCLHGVAEANNLSFSLSTSPLILAGNATSIYLFSLFLSFSISPYLSLSLIYISIYLETTSLRSKQPHFLSSNSFALLQQPRSTHDWMLIRKCRDARWRHRGQEKEERTGIECPLVHATGVNDGFKN